MRITAKYLLRKNLRRAKRPKRLKNRKNKSPMMKNRTLGLKEATNLLKRQVKKLLKRDPLLMLILP